MEQSSWLLVKRDHVLRVRDHLSNRRRDHRRFRRQC